MTRADLVEYLPWLLSAFTFGSMWMAGNVKRWAWAVALAGQVWWFVWIIASEAWGLMPSCIALTFLYAVNHLRWSDRR